MAEIQVSVLKEWTAEIRFGDGEVPDLPKRYSSIVMRPYAATVRFTARDSKDPSLRSIAVHGHRVNKNSLGATTYEEYWSLEDTPVWLAPFIGYARGLLDG